MSGQSSNGGTISNSGIGTKEGGLVIVPSAPHGGTNGPISNQPQLVLDSSVFHGLSPAGLHAIKIAQVSFARDVSTAAAIAYESVLTQLRQSSDKPPTDTTESATVA